MAVTRVSILGMQPGFYSPGCTVCSRGIQSWIYSMQPGYIILDQQSIVWVIQSWIYVCSLGQQSTQLCGLYLHAINISISVNIFCISIAGSDTKQLFNAPKEREREREREREQGRERKRERGRERVRRKMKGIRIFVTSRVSLHTDANALKRKQQLITI